MQTYFTGCISKLPKVPREHLFHLFLCRREGFTYDVASTGLVCIGWFCLVFCYDSAPTGFLMYFCCRKNHLVHVSTFSMEGINVT